MREIKFRLWDGQRMIEHYKIVAKYFIELDGTVWENVGCFEYDTLTERTDVEIMQHTGLKDKNGVEIYEGDIIGRTTFPDKVIIWHEYGFGYYRVNNNEKYSIKYLDQFDVVIGNVYEHPHLLNTTV